MAEDDAEETHGLFRLYPTVYRPAACNVDIVALHGLNGSAIKTWTDKKGHLWLRDSLPDHIPNARIMTFGYDSALRSSNSRTTMHLSDFAEDLLTRLVYARQDPLEKNRGLVFICHSLGGLVLKQALVMAQLAQLAQLDKVAYENIAECAQLDKVAYENIAECTSGIAFFGTPHRGSNSASPARILSRIVNAATFGQTLRSDLLEALTIQSRLLDALTRMSSTILGKMSVVSFYEQKPHSVTGSLIVDPFSAVLGMPNERAIPINEDHRGITRHSPRHPHRYLPVWSSIKDLVHQALLKSRKDYDNLLDALFCVDYKTAQLRPRQPHPGTGNWIFDEPTFTDWLDSRNSGVLLLSAPAGFGKTVLTRHIMEEVLAGHLVYGDKAMTSAGVSFFCSYNEQGSTSEQTVLRSLLHQLLLLCPQAQDLVRNRLLAGDKYSLMYKLDTPLLWQCIRDVLSMDDMGRTFICVDAMEELNAEDCKSLITGFNDLVGHINAHSAKNHRIRVFLSSRPNASFRTRYPSMKILSAARYHVEGDIEIFLRDSITAFSRKQPDFAAAITVDGSEKIVGKITSRADGMFLWASLAWENFAHGFIWNEDVLEERLKDLEATPPGINSLYTKTLDRIDPAVRKDMWIMFSILAIAKSPLTERQLGEVLSYAVLKRKGIVDPREIRPVKGIAATIEKHFAELVTIHDDGTVLFTHLSLKDYLLGTWKSDRPDILERAHESIAGLCLSYIRYWEVPHEPLEVQDEHQKLHLAQYASLNHLPHLATLPLDHRLWMEYADSADSAYFPGNFSSPLHLLLHRSMDPWSGRPLLSLEQYHQVVRNFVSRGYDINRRDSPKRGALLNTCCERSWVRDGYRRSVAFLLEVGADPNLYPTNGRSNLRAALASKMSDIRDLLLFHPKFDRNQVDEQGQTALHGLVDYCEEDDVDILLKHGDVEVNVQDRFGYTPLHIAATRDKVAVVRRLLQDPTIRLDLPDKQGRTPLAVATWWGIKDVALAIIERSEAFPLPESEHVQALIAAAKHGEEELVRALLSKTRHRGLGRETDESGKSFLHHATMNNWHEIMAQCLKSEDSMNINRIDHSGGTALHYGAKLGCTEACHVLISYGATTRVQNRNGMTAAQLAADAGFKDTLLLIVQDGEVDANQRDHSGKNLVHWAATLDCLDVMKRVCEQPGVELARRDNSGKMPVDYAYQCQCPQVGRYLSLRMRHMALSFTWWDPYDWESVFERAAAQGRHVQDAAIRPSDASPIGNYRRKSQEEKIYCSEDWALVLTRQARRARKRKYKKKKEAQRLRAQRNRE